MNKNFSYIKASEYYSKITDGTHDSPKQQEIGRYLITSKHIKGRTIDFDTAYFISDADFKKINERSKVEQWDVIVSMIGEYCGFCYIERDVKINYAVKNVGIFKAATQIEAEWLYYYLSSPIGKQKLKQIKSGSSQPYLSLGGLRNLPILQPSNNTMKSNIVSLLSSLDSKIALNNRINAELEAMAKTVYDYWFVQFDFPFDFAQGKPSAEGKPYKSSGGKMVWCEELKREVPEGWKVDRINNVIEVKDGTHDSPKAKSEGYRLITSKNLLPSGLDFESANFISEEDYININKRSKVDTGDILFSMIGSIGVVYKVEDEEINFAVKNVALYKTSQKPDYKNYIYQYLKSYDMENYMGNVISGSIQKFISLGSLRNMPLLLNDDIILKFQKATEHLFVQLENNKKQNQQLSSLRDWLLPMLMNGQVVSTTINNQEEKEENWNGLIAAEPGTKYGK